VSERAPRLQAAEAAVLGAEMQERRVRRRYDKARTRLDHAVTCVEEAAD
jgi:hypothetical protein